MRHMWAELQVPIPSKKTVLGELLPEEPPAVEGTGVSARRKHLDEKFCHECGAAIRAKAIICPKCGVKQPSPDYEPREYDEPPASSNRIAAGVFAILLGALGIHKFVLGFPVAGVIMLLVTVLTCGWGGIVMGIIGLVEGILYLSKSDREFHKVYVVKKRSWF